MRLDVKDKIGDVLGSAEEPLTFDQIKDKTNLRPQDLRTGLKELIKKDDMVYVDGVEDGERLYTTYD